MDDPELTIDPTAEQDVPKPTPAKRNGRKPTAQDEEKFFGRGEREYELEHGKQDKGWVGMALGSRESAPIYVACIIALLLTIALVGSFFVPANYGTVDAQRLADGQKLLLGLLTTVLGFLFGASTRK